MASSIWSLYIRHFLAYANSAVHSVVVRGPFFENVVVTRSDCLVDFLLVAKYHEFFGFNYLNDLYAFDNMAASRRFTIVYRISNPALKTSLLVTTSASEGVPVATAQNVYAAAAWPEREAWEMVGVYFAGHRRIQKLLTDYGLRGHPLRKDFPVVGYVECFFSYRTRGIEFVPVEFMQEYRKFEFYENWAAAGVAHEDSISGAGAAGPLDREIA